MPAANHQLDDQSVDSVAPIENMIGSSDVMKRVYSLTQIAAQSRVPVLLSGEMGTGKEHVAKAIHQQGPRSNSPWVMINCGSESKSMIEEMIFCHEGSGQLQLANGGTLLIDEVNRLSDTAQVRLLQVLLDGKFQPPGTAQLIPVDVRLIASSNVDLSKEVAEGRFREDLYWCLNVFPIDLPPVRRRTDDIDDLVAHYLKTYSKATGKSVTKIHPDAQKALRAYPFPGNLRELQNYVLRAIVLAPGNELTPDLLPVTVTGGVQDAQSAVFRPTDDEALLREFVYSQLSKAEVDQTNLFEGIVGPLEKELIIQVLDACNQTQTKAAKRLGINRNTLYKKMVEFGLARPPTETKE